MLILNTRYLLLLSAIVLLLTGKGLAQLTDFPRFTRIDKANGLPTTLITWILKDRRNLVWMGTENYGLLRYDGKLVKSYLSDKNTSARFPHWVGEIKEDADGWLWLETTMGLYHFDPVTEKIRVFKNQPGNPSSIASNEKPKPFIDSRGRLWVSSAKGLQLLDCHTQQFISYQLPAISNISWQKNAQSIGKLFEDSQQNLWASSAYGIYRIDTLNRVCVPYFTGNYSWVTSIAETDSNHLWVSFWGEGLKQFDKLNGKYTDVYKPKSIIKNLATWYDENNRLWLCIGDDQLILFDPDAKQAYTVPPTNSPSFNLAGPVQVICTNSTGKELWIATDRALFCNNGMLNKFTQIPMPGASSEISGSTPRSLIILPHTYMIANWPNGSVYTFTKNWNLLSAEYQPYFSDKENQATVNTLDIDQQGHIWMGTNWGLVSQLGQKRKQYLPTDTFLQKDEAYYARNMVSNGDGRYWVRFPERGVYLFDPVRGVFEKNYRYQYKGKATVLKTDTEGKIWLGTDAGLYQYIKERDSFVRVIGYADSIPNATNDLVFTGNYGWVATATGLIRFDKNTFAQTLITDNLHQGGTNTFRILADSLQHIWMMLQEELAVYNPETGKFSYFSTADGLPENFMGWPGFLKLVNDSTLAIGSAGYITTLNPYSLLQKPPVGQVIITDIWTDNERRWLTGQQPSLVVAPGTRTISFHFAYPYYKSIAQNKILYRISDRWGNAGWTISSTGDINFINLSPGIYQLDIKGETGNGSIYSVPLSVTIIVKAHWYQSSGFKIMFIAVACLLVALLVTWRIRSIKQTTGLKQKMAETEMAALKAQMNPHFIFNCINSIDAFIQSNDRYNATRYLNRFARLIRNILDSSTHNTVPFNKDIETLQLYLELEQLRSSHPFTVDLRIDDELSNEDYAVPPLVVQPFVENAIVHGLRNLPLSNGRLQINISSTSSHIRYEITDNGVGRKEAASYKTPTEESYGIKMSIERIKLFNQEPFASVEISDVDTSQKYTGTRVIILLKKL